MPVAQPQTIDLPPLCVRAELSSINDEARTADLIFSTGASVDRMDFWSGKRYREVLAMKPENVRLDRLNSRAPLLNSHAADSLDDVIGVVEPGTARMVNGQGVATVRFSKRAAVDPVWQDVKDGVIRSVSVGYRVHKFNEADGDNKMPVRTAVDWEPYEISMVPMPADIGARVRSGDKFNTNPCVIIAREAEETAMAKAKQRQNPAAETDVNEQSETIVERDPLDPGAPIAARSANDEAETETEPNERDLGAGAERERCQGIYEGCEAARLPLSFAKRLIADGTSLEESRGLMLQEIGKREGASVPTHRGGNTKQVIVGDDPLVHVRGGIMNAILHRVAPTYFKLDDNGRQYRGMTLMDTARMFLQAQGIRTTGLSKMELAGMAMGVNVRAGYSTASDFANLLADVANKTLRRAYDEAPQTYAQISRAVTLPDFKSVKRLQLGEAPQLLAVDDHGEFTRGSIGEGKEQFQLATYGRVFAITRKALVNDDTDAFSRIPMLFGRAARSLESNIVWQQLLANAAMGDGTALFHANHSNLSGTSDAISVAAIGAGRAAMRKQTGVDATTLLNLNPMFLIVPPSKETLADQFISTNLLASQSSNVNPFAGRLTVISEPRLEVGVGSTAGSATAWYLSASPDQIDIIEYGYLEGEDGPVVESRIGFDVDGLEIKCRHDFAAKVIDWRGLYKNAGA